MSDNTRTSLFSWILGRRKDSAPQGQAPSQGTEQPLVELLPDELALVEAGRLIAAVKVCRDRTGVSLKTAKQSVDAARNAIGTSTTGQVPAQPTSPQPGYPVSYPSSTELTPEELTLLAQDKQVAAIQALRKRTGLGLVEARNIVWAAQDARTP